MSYCVTDGDEPAKAPETKKILVTIWRPRVRGLLCTRSFAQRPKSDSRLDAGTPNARERLLLKFHYVSRMTLRRLECPRC